MSDDNKSGSELDIFEGLGKKSSTTRSSVAPPPPPGASSEARVSAAPPAPPQPVEVKKTLLGIAAPLSPQTSVAPAARPSRPPLPPSSSTITAARPSQPAPPRPSQNPDAPPPPPKRASLPNLQAATPIKTPTATAQDAVATEPLAADAKLDMDWDDDNEATHVYDKDKDKDKADKPEESTLDDSKELETAPVLGPGVGKPRSSMPPPPPPGSQGMRAASAPPPPPPPSAMPSTRPAGSPPSSAGLRSSTPPPLPPQPLGNLENQTVTEPLIPPTPSRPPSLPPPPPAGLAVARTPSVAPPPPTALPIESQMTSRSMEATQMVRRSGASRNGLLFLLLVAVAVCAGLAVYFAMPRSGKLVINVTDPKGFAVANLEVLVEGKKVCDATPCVAEVSSGVHRIQVQAAGYQPAAPKAVSVDGNLNLDFVLTPAGGSSSTSTVQGTGIKVNGAQPGFRLMVDGKEIGPLPQEVRDLTPGEHKVKVIGGAAECSSTDPATLKRCRYASLEKTVTVSKDEMVDLGALALKVVLGKVTILPGTPGAKVFLVSGGDRKVLAELPKAVEIDTTKASWTLEAEKTGFNDFSQPISFEDGQAEKSITVNLEPKGAKPAVAVAAAAPAAATPKAEAPKPEARVETPKEEPKTETPAPKEEPKAETAGGMGTLKINSLPASAVLLDGKPIGQTPVLGYKVPAGEHNIRFVNTELSLQKQITVTVKAGETKAAFAKLRD